MMGEGPSLGTLLGTLETMPNVCLSGARRARLPAMKLFGWDDAKNAEIRKAETGTICEMRLGASGE